MAKQSLEIKDFTGGLNAFSDARDINGNEFSQVFNVTSGQDGIVRIGGGLIENIRNLPHNNANYQEGYGLFATSIDSTPSILDSEFETGFEEGTVASYTATQVVITLSTLPSFQSVPDHNTDDFYRNMTILIYSGNGIGQCRRIVSYAGDTKIATITDAFSSTSPHSAVPNNSSKYKIFRIAGDNTKFGNAGELDYFDKGGSDFPYDDTNSHGTDYQNSYFLRTKSGTISDGASLDLGFVTYNPKSHSWAAGDALSTDNTSQGNNVLKSGIRYTFSFWCKAAYPYYGYISDADNSANQRGERVPFLQIYSDSVTDGTNTGLYLFQSSNGTVFLPGSDSTYNYADNLTNEHVKNGDFEDGTATGGIGGHSHIGNTHTYCPPTDWYAYDGFAHNTNNTITYSFENGADAYGDEGNTLNMNPGSAFAIESNAIGVIPNCYLYQDLTLEDNQWYELSYIYSTSATNCLLLNSIVDTFDLTSTGIVSNESTLAATDGEAELTVDGITATDALVKNREIYIKSFSDSTCDTTNTDATVTCDASNHIKVGQGVTGTGIPVDTTISSVNTPGAVTSFELSANATASNSNTELIFTDNSGLFLGVCNTVDSDTQITFEAGTMANIPDNTTLYVANYINKWDENLNASTAGITLYFHGGTIGDATKRNPLRFFVPNNSGTPRVIRIAFAPSVESEDIRLDGVSVKKSLPDLVSMSNKMNSGISSELAVNPYSSSIQSWSKYEVTFKIPYEYNDATDWVINLNAGSYGFQNGATDSYNNQTVYFDTLRLETSDLGGNLIFLNDNTATESKINIYSEEDNKWQENTGLTWAGVNMKPVYNYINGMLKISDANFESGNTSKLFYYYNSKHQIRENPLSLPPVLEVDFNSNGFEIDDEYQAVNYINEHSYLNGHQNYSVDSVSNWDLDKLNSHNGRIIWHWQHGTAVYGTATSIEEQSLFDSNNVNLTDVLPDNAKTNPMYFTWCGQHGGSGNPIDNEDMHTQINTHTSGSISQIKFEFTYSFQGTYSASSGGGNLLRGMHPPIFHIYAGKRTGTDVFASGSIVTDDHKKQLSRGTSSFITASNNRKAVIYNDSDYSDVYDIQEEIDAGISWTNSLQWPNDTVIDPGHNDGHIRTSEKTFYGIISLEDGDIEITDDVIFKVHIVYPPNSNGWGMQDSLLRGYDSAAYDFTCPRWEKIKFTSILCSFRTSNWTPSGDGFTASDFNKTKTNFSFGTPSNTTAFGWGERMFITGVSSVNIFDEESSIEVNNSIVGLTATNNVETSVSTITSGQCPDVSVYVSMDMYNDDYKRELKYYMKDTTSDIWYLQFYVNLEKNVIYSTTSNFKATGVRSDVHNCYQYFIPKENILNYNEVDSYESQTLVSQELKNTELICDYKTSVVANSRLYVGNVKQNGIHYPDRMLKSPIGKYNILPKSNFIDVAINDGDEITALEYYKDKLLQFKKRKVFIINTSGDYEFLEDTIDNSGVNLPCQVCKTPFGVVWANRAGLFVYDGNTISNLIDGKMSNQKIDEHIDTNSWQIQNDYAGLPSDDNKYVSAIGYDPKIKEIIVRYGIKRTTSGDGSDGLANSNIDGYVYSLVTKSWYMTHKVFNGISRNTYKTASSNFVNAKNGDLIAYNYQTGDTYDINDIMKWKHAEATDEDMCTTRAIAAEHTNERLMYFTTADYTFGNIAARKKIYKIYITYKAAANTNILVKYSTNGSEAITGTFADSSTNYAAATGLVNTNDLWETAILTPSSSINNIHSFKLQFTNVNNTANGNTEKKFQINDISIIYRQKRVK